MRVSLFILCVVQEYMNEQFNLLREQLRESVRSLKNLQEDIQKAVSDVKLVNTQNLSCVTFFGTNVFPPPNRKRK